MILLWFADLRACCSWSILPLRTSHDLLGLGYWQVARHCRGLRMWSGLCCGRAWWFTPRDCATAPAARGICLWSQRDLHDHHRPRASKNAHCRLWESATPKGQGDACGALQSNGHCHAFQLLGWFENGELLRYRVASCSKIYNISYK